ASPACLLGGLGVGSLWLGPKADHHPRPLRLYALLEAIIALSAAATPVLLAGVRALYLASGGSMRLGMAASTILRLVLSIAVLAVPTIALGGTLPAAARTVPRLPDVPHPAGDVQYGLHTPAA